MMRSITARRDPTGGWGGQVTGLRSFDLEPALRSVAKDRLPRSAPPSARCSDK